MTRRDVLDRVIGTVVGVAVGMLLLALNEYAHAAYNLCTPDQQYQPTTVTWVAHHIVNGVPSAAAVQGSCPVYQDTASGAYWFGLCDLNGISRPSQAYSVQITASPGSSGTGPTGFAFDYTCGPAAVTVAGQTLTGETACSVSGVTLGGNCPPAGSIKVSG